MMQSIKVTGKVYPLSNMEMDGRTIPFSSRIIDHSVMVVIADEVECEGRRIAEIMASSIVNNMTWQYMFGSSDDQQSMMLIIDPSKEWSDRYEGWAGRYLVKIARSVALQVQAFD